MMGVYVLVKMLYIILQYFNILHTDIETTDPWTRNGKSR